MERRWCSGSTDSPAAAAQDGRIKTRVSTGASVGNIGSSGFERGGGREHGKLPAYCVSPGLIYKMVCPFAGQPGIALSAARANERENCRRSSSCMNHKSEIAPSRKDRAG